MRRILIEKARHKHRVRRGGGRQRLDLDNIQLLDDATPEAVLALNEALERLAEGKPVVGQVVKLRFFAGLSIKETAEALKTRRERPIATGASAAPGCINS